MARTSPPVWPATQTSALNAVRIFSELTLIVAAPVVTAVVVGARERAGWDTDDAGDPDGDSIVLVLQVVSSVAALLAVCVLVAVFEVLRRRRRRSP